MAATSIVRLALESNQYESKLRADKRMFEDFASSIGVNLKKMTAYGAALGVASMAINKLTSELSEAISKSIEMAKASEGIEMAFARLDRPDLLKNLRKETHNTISDLELMKHAVKFDNFGLDLNQMGTFLQFAQQQAKDTGQSIDFMVESIVTGLGRKSLPILDNLGLSANEIREKMKETGDMTTAVAQIIQERMEAAGGYVETAADRAAQAETALNNELVALGKTLAPLAETGASVFKDIELAAIKALNDGVGPLVPKLIGLKDTFKGVSDIVSNSSVFQGYISAMQTVADKALRILGPLSTVYNLLANIATMAGSEGVGAGAAVGGAISGVLTANGGELPGVTVTGSRKRNPTKPTGGDVGSSRKDFMSAIAFNPMSDSSMKYDPSQHAQASGLRPENILGPSEEWEKYKDTITGTIDTIGDGMSNLTEWTADFDPYRENMEKMTKAAKASQQAMSLAASAANSLGAAFGNMEDPGAKAAGMVVSAIASIALGFAQAAAARDTVASGWAWLLWVVAGLSAMATSIATVHNLTGYAQGGIVKGNSYSGDNIYGGPDAMVNAGELVLTKAQQSTLASALQGNGMQNMNIAGRIKGTDIILSIDRSLQLQGKQLLTWG